MFEKAYKNMIIVIIKEIRRIKSYKGGNRIQCVILLR